MRDICFVGCRLMKIYFSVSVWWCGHIISTLAQFIRAEWVIFLSRTYTIFDCFEHILMHAHLLCVAEMRRLRIFSLFKMYILYYDIFGLFLVNANHSNTPREIERERVLEKFWYVESLFLDNIFTWKARPLIIYAGKKWNKS